MTTPNERTAASAGNTALSSSSLVERRTGVPSREAVEEWTNILEGKGLLVPANMLRDLRSALDAEQKQTCSLRAEVERLTKALSENDTHWARMIVAVNATVEAQAAELEKVLELVKIWRQVDNRLDAQDFADELEFALASQYSSAEVSKDTSQLKRMNEEWSEVDYCGWNKGDIK